MRNKQLIVLYSSTYIPLHKEECSSYSVELVMELGKPNVIPAIGKSPTGVLPESCNWLPVLVTA